MAITSYPVYILRLYDYKLDKSIITKYCKDMEIVKMVLKKEYYDFEYKTQYDGSVDTWTLCSKDSRILRISSVYVIDRYDDISFNEYWENQVAQELERNKNVEQD